MIPYLGFAFFIVGFPRPQRNWQEISPVVPAKSETKSDGHIFSSMNAQFHVQLQKMIQSDPYSYDTGSFYLLKNEKMIMLLNILERGNDYVLYNLKGAELQEVTSCHDEENGYIAEVLESVFEPNQPAPKKAGLVDPRFAFSLAPMRTVSFSLYDDIKYSLKGMIEN
jgi:hypothetical protein